MRILRAMFGAACVTGIVASPASASDVTVWAPSTYIEEAIERQLEATFESADLPGTLAWPEGGRNATVTRTPTGVLSVSTNLVYSQVIQVGSLSFLAQSPTALTIEIALSCRGVRYDVDARNPRVTAGGIVFQGSALAGIERQVEGGIVAGLAAFDEAVINATTGYGVPQQAKCVAVSVDSNAALTFDFDLGCVEGASLAAACPSSLVGAGIVRSCVNRTWTVASYDCERTDNK